MRTPHQRIVQIVDNVLNGGLLCDAELGVEASRQPKGKLLAFPVVQPINAIGLGKAAAAQVGDLGRAEHGLGQALADLDLALQAGLLRLKQEILGGLGVADRHACLLIGIDIGHNVRQLGVLGVSAHNRVVDLKLVFQLAGLLVLVQDIVAFGVGHLPAVLIQLHRGLQLAQRVLPQQVLQGLVGVQIAGSCAADPQGLSHVGVNHQVRALLHLEIQLEGLVCGVGVCDLNLLPLEGLLHRVVEGGGVVLGVQLRDIIAVGVLEGVSVGVHQLALLNGRQLNLLGGAVQAQIDGLARQVIGVSLVPGQPGHHIGVELDGADLVLIGIFQVQPQHGSHLIPGLGDIDGVARLLLIIKGDAPVLHLDPDAVIGSVGAAAGEVDLLVGQLPLNQLGQNLIVAHIVLRNILLLGQLGPDLIHGLYIVHLVKHDADRLGAVIQHKASVQLAQLGGAGHQVDALVGQDAASVPGLQVAGGPELGGGGQLAHPVQGNLTAALAAGGHPVREQAQGLHLDGAVEKAGGGQVCSRGIGGIFAGKAHHLTDNAAIGILLPLNLGNILAQAADLCLVAFDQIFDHAFCIQAAGQASNRIGAVHKAAHRIAAAYSAERRHNTRSFHPVSKILVGLFQMCAKILCTFLSACSMIKLIALGERFYWRRSLVRYHNHYQPEGRRGQNYHVQLPDGRPAHPGRPGAGR